MDPQTGAQWIALGGAAALLFFLLRWGASYQSVMTDGAWKRIKDLETTVTRLDKELWAERRRCDGLARKVARLEAAHVAMGLPLGDGVSDVERDDVG